MSEKTGVLDETGQASSKVVQHIKDGPVSTALIILAIGFVLGKIL